MLVTNAQSGTRIDEVADGICRICTPLPPTVVPGGWDCGFRFEERTRTVLCGDLFTQGGASHEPRTQADILGPSEAFRKIMDYYAHGPNTGQVLDRLAATKPAMLACMHGSAWQGDGEAVLKALSGALSA